MEHLGLDIVGVLATQGVHGLLVVLCARVLVDFVVVLVELLQCGEPVALALRLRADGLTFQNCIEPTLQGRGIPRADERIRPLTHRDAPVGDRARRVGFRNCVEGFHRLREVERMQHRQRAIELLLALSRARSLE